MNKDNKILFYGGNRNAVQSTLDFDFACGKDRTSLVGIVKPGVEFWSNYNWGDKEILIQTFSYLEDAFDKHPDIGAVVNFASERSAASVAFDVIKRPGVRYQVIVAEGMPERDARKIRLAAKRAGQTVIGPATYGCLRGGELRLGNIGGSIELQAEANVHYKGSVGIVTKSGGLLNELCNIVGNSTDGIHTAISVGGDVYPCTRLIDVVEMYEKDSDIKMIVMLGEIGGRQELEVAEAIKDGRVEKPVVAWVSGICASVLPGEFQFGHAGAVAKSKEESAETKNRLLRDAGAIVPDSYDGFDEVVQEVARGVGILSASADAPKLSHVDMSVFQNRYLSNLVSTISDDRGESPKYMNEKIVDLAGDPSVTIGDIISLLWFRKKLPRVALDFFDIIIKLVADHGPNVSGSHNTIIAARAGKDLVSSVASGFLTIGPRFGGAISASARNWLECVRDNISPREFVDEKKRSNIKIPGIGHKYKSKLKPDGRVALLDDFVRERLQSAPHLDFARAVEEITLRKRHNLILNIDGTIAAAALDIFKECGFQYDEIEEIVENETLNGLFVLGRTIGLIGHHIDQKRLKAPLYRHPIEDTLYWNDKEL